MRKLIHILGLAVAFVVVAVVVARADVDSNNLVTMAPQPYMPGANVTAAPAASASAACTGLTGGAIYYITCDQNFRLRQGSGTPTATATDFGPIAANTIIRGRLGTASAAFAFYNLGTAAANCSCAPEVK